MGSFMDHVTRIIHQNDNHAHKRDDEVHEIVVEPSTGRTTLPAKP
jgi:hypothetical protein